MSDIYRKPSSGEDFTPSARQFRAFIDAAHAHAEGRHQPGGASPGSFGITVNVLNDTGSDCPWFGVLTVDDIVVPPGVNLTEFLNNATLKSTNGPDDSEPAHRIVIAQEPIRSGTIGRCLIFGVTPCKLEIEEARDYHRAELTATSEKLKAADGGPVALVWNPRETGDHYGLVKLENATPGRRFFELETDLVECGGGPATAWEVRPVSGESGTYWERINESAAAQIWPGHEWRGVAFGVLEEPAPGTFGVGATRGEIVQAFQSSEPEAGGKLIALGTGHTTLLLQPDQDYQKDEVGAGICNWTDPGDCGTHDLELLDVVAYGVDDVVFLEDVRGTDRCLAVWSNQQWFATPIDRRDAACGLKVEEDTESADFGKIVVDDAIAGCGLTFEDCELSVDNSQLAGTGLVAEGDCAVAVDCPNFCERIAVLEACCETLTEIVEELIECCQDSRECCEESMLCCYENQEAIDYINDYCCGSEDGGIPGANDCSTRCLWRSSTGVTWDELLVPCAGPDDCDCAEPTWPPVGPGDLAFTDCSSSSQGAGPCCECTGSVDVHVAAPCLGIDETKPAACNGSADVDNVEFEAPPACGNVTLEVDIGCDTDRDVVICDWYVENLDTGCFDEGRADATDVTCTGGSLSASFEFDIDGNCCCQAGSQRVTVTVD